MAVFYRKRTQPFGSGNAQAMSVRLSPETREGFLQIKTAFQQRFPLEKFPTLGACLDHALRRFLDEVGNDPRILQFEVDQFKARYAKPEDAR